MDSQYLQTAILELLSDRPLEVGARLKQRLNRTLLNAGLPAFDEKQFGFRKFSEFLISELGDYLLVEKPREGGDIQITLKHRLVASPSSPLGTNDVPHVASAKPLPVRMIRGDVWQAFTHLNEHRKRYLDRESGKVLHFLDTDSANVALVAEAPGRFVEIARIDAETQLSWMQHFLAISNFPDAEAATLSQLFDQPYSSQLSVLFGRALGERQAEWKRYRAERVTEIVQSWAGEHGVALSPLFTFKVGQSAEPAEAAPSTPSGQLSPREQAQKLLGMMTDQEVVSIAIPALLGYVLANTRL
ncbi:OST-HTH/LOTUS domain-containing protein [Pseudomonas hunanensis]|uniref:OST-HTH/LOTUS domain-containing protein n=1 Tax=Pseudomonas hunanensis TaxID=1247546 RepID=UPI0030D7CAF8